MEQLREWSGDFLFQLTQTSLLEWFGVGFAVIQVLLAKANRVLLYPFGIASVIITIYVLALAGLYAEVLLNVYYLVMSIYGWVHWMRGRAGASAVTDKDASDRTPSSTLVVVAFANRREWLTTIAIVLLGTPLLYYALVDFTDSTVPLWDAWVTSTAWAGMWLLARRRIENWILLNISNAFAIPLLAHKGLQLYALLTVFLFIVAVLGYLDWQKIIRDRHEKLRHTPH